MTADPEFSAMGTLAALAMFMYENNGDAAWELAETLSADELVEVIDVGINTVVATVQALHRVAVNTRLADPRAPRTAVIVSHLCAVLHGLKLGFSGQELSTTAWQDAIDLSALLREYPDRPPGP